MPLTLYHGTLASSVPSILQNGLKPGHGWGGAGQFGVFLTKHVDEAEEWAKWKWIHEVNPDAKEPTRFERYGGKPSDIAVLRVTIPDEATVGLQADMEQAEDFQFEGVAGDWQDALSHYGSVMFPYAIPREWIVRDHLTEDVAATAYHVTEIGNLPSILRDGLTPSTPNEWDKRGVYMFPDRTSVENAMMNWMADELEGDVVILEIDLAFVRDRYSDVGYEIATPHTIPPQAIVAVYDEGWRRIR